MTVSSLFFLYIYGVIFSFCLTILEKYFASVKKAYLRKDWNKKEFKSVYQERIKVISTIYPKKEFDKLFKKYFKILKTDYCKKYPSCKTSIFYIARK